MELVAASCIATPLPCTSAAEKKRVINDVLDTADAYAGAIPSLSTLQRTPQDRPPIIPDPRLLWLAPSTSSPVPIVM